MLVSGPVCILLLRSFFWFPKLVTQQQLCEQKYFIKVLTVCAHFCCISHKTHPKTKHPSPHPSKTTLNYLMVKNKKGFESLVFLTCLLSSVHTDLMYLSGLTCHLCQLVTRIFYFSQNIAVEIAKALFTLDFSAIVCNKFIVIINFFCQNYGVDKKFGVTDILGITWFLWESRKLKLNVPCITEIRVPCMF